MTYCEEVGLKVGDKIKLNCPLQDMERYVGSCFRPYSNSDIYQLTLDDGSYILKFTKLNTGEWGFIEINKVKWEKLVEEGIPTDTIASLVTKDTIVNVELTWEEVINLKFLAGKCNFLKGSVWFKLSNLITEHLNHDVLDQVAVLCDIKLQVANKDYYQWVDSHFMSPHKAKALELRKQAEELIKQAEELEGK